MGWHDVHYELCTVAWFQRSAVEEELLDHSPAGSRQAEITSCHSGMGVLPLPVLPAPVLPRSWLSWAGAWSVGSSPMG
jgi:hypothetical protein